LRFDYAAKLPNVCRSAKFLPNLFPAAPPFKQKTMPFVFKKEGHRFRKRRSSFLQTTAVISKNHCGRFQKPLRSFSETSAAGIFFWGEVGSL